MGSTNGAIARPASESQSSTTFHLPQTSSLQSQENSVQNGGSGSQGQPKWVQKDAAALLDNIHRQRPQFQLQQPPKKHRTTSISSPIPYRKPKGTRKPTRDPQLPSEIAGAYESNTPEGSPFPAPNVAALLEPRAIDDESLACSLFKPFRTGIEEECFNGSQRIVKSTSLYDQGKSFGEVKFLEARMASVAYAERNGEMAPDGAFRGQLEKFERKRTQEVDARRDARIKKAFRDYDEAFQQNLTAMDRGSPCSGPRVPCPAPPPEPGYETGGDKQLQLREDSAEAGMRYGLQAGF